ncbi:isoaspartyl peptidase/L-asparaginase [bacterium]|nr:isoaspartyl peptidase/L-asparaginase [bacterium]
MRRFALPIALLLLVGCQQVRDLGPVPVTYHGGAAVGALAVTHGGAGSPSSWSPHTQAAAQAALHRLAHGGTALDAAVAGTQHLEDIPIFNAGTGANIRLDGRTIQMDAALMTSDGDFAAVAALERVRNPIRVAQAVQATPHRMLVGDGATRFAHRMGFADEVPICPEAQAKWRRRVARLLRGEAGGGYDTFDWRAAWNFPNPVPTPEDTLVDDPVQGDTVGTVVRHADGTFAATLSTGGTSITLDGRVGDVPIYGCGCFAGPAGAVACTGHGEEIIRQGLAREVYRLMEGGLSAQEAIRAGIADFDPAWTVGVIAVGRDGWGVGANTDMAYGVAGGSE